MKTIFGPVLSRRFGASLGIDLSPSQKQCNFDCLYCELKASHTVTAQDDVVSLDLIIDELKEALHTHPHIDVITLTANGEPTLYPYLDELIDQIDQIKDNKQTLILTNSSTITEEKTFQTLLKLDQVKFSLDAISADIFKKIDRPHKEIKIEDIAQKIIEFSHIFRGKLFIEILFVDKINNKEDEIKKLNETLLKMKNITRVDIGTIDRPPAYDVKPISFSELHKISMMFDHTLPIHIASRKEFKCSQSFYSKEEILNTLDKRPLTIDDIKLLFDEESQNLFYELLEDKKISIIVRENLHFYTKA